MALLEGGKRVAATEFPKDPHAIAERLLKIRRGEILAEERELAKGVIQVTEARLKPLGEHAASPTWEGAEAHGFDAALLREASLLVAREESKAANVGRDRFIAQTVKAMDELQRSVNTLVERLRDWYGLHFPEVLRKIPDQPTFAKLLAESPGRLELAKKVGGANAADSIGIEFSPDELGVVRAYAQSLSSLYAERDALEVMVEREVQQIAPTLSGVVGPLLAARLIAQAGGLEKLAGLPASTIQTLGAENALFLHLKEGKKPPKHGLLFQHALVNTSPWHQRGKISRLLAGQATIAARMDAYNPQAGDRSAPLVAVVEKGAERIKARKRAMVVPAARFKPKKGGRR